jgi:Arc/MetJ family transcription regulator
MCREVADMETRTNIILDADLIKEAQELTALKTKKDVVDFALQELVKHYRRRKLLSLRRQGLWEGNLEEMRRERVDNH